jgi:hypothetical protein
MEQRGAENLEAEKVGFIEAFNSEPLRKIRTNGKDGFADFCPTQIGYQQ